MIQKVFSAILALTISLSCFPTIAQTITSEELTYLTSNWDGPRFEDGRPKIPDALLRRAMEIGIDDAWTVLKNNGYTNQFDGGWKTVNNNIIVGRALTAMFMPSRPDIHKLIMNRGTEELGRKGNTNSWPIDVLSKGDVYVADGFGKIGGGTLIGATLGNSIFSKSGNGVVFNGSARDLNSLAEIPGFNAFVRDFHPSFLEEMTLMGLNTPIRIGDAIVLPGDLVIADREGVLFVPAHLAELVISTAEFVTRKDLFGIEMIKSGVYSTGEIDSQWPESIKIDFLEWLKKHPELGEMTKAELDLVLSSRTW